ncbi:MAG TPA: response regulator, partial [Anaeromyxobacteraceae bacterium]|nr:response regulator [Anaeromyxobacteraceae bacterium]
FYSEPGRGTSMKVYLPLHTAAAATAATAPAPQRESARPSNGRETILVVEDEEVLIKLATRSLATAGYNVLAARDGEEGLRTAAQYPGDIHLLATDVIMPRMGGRALATELAKVRPGIKVLYMSGYTADAMLQHGVLEEGIHLIAKPFTTAELAQKVREVLDQGAAARG